MIGHERRGYVGLVLDEQDRVVQLPAVQRALAELQATLWERGFASQHGISDGPLLLIGSADSRLAAGALAGCGVSPPRAPESLCLRQVAWQGRYALLVCGADARGLAYALYDLAGQVEAEGTPQDSLSRPRCIRDEPANRVRGVLRFFVSEVEDKPWFYDQEFWRRYLSMLVRARFNRFSLTLAAGYDAPRNITDSYFFFPYPFLLDVPGYGVQVVNLPPAERERNLAALQFISGEAAALGLDFYLGIWNHQPTYQASPQATYPIQGIGPGNHGPYCRNALRHLLMLCPDISGITLRVNHESGVVEGSHAFWSQVYEGIATCGRKVAIELRAKGIDERLIELALQTGQPVSVSTKYIGEHMGLPCHTAEIRSFEKAPRVHPSGAGARRFTRYSYADLLREDRRYGFLFQLWPGTQRVLLWGDPAMAAAYSREAGFCGSQGLELMEPLSWKGRRGAGQPDGRNLYLDPTLATRWEFEKFEYGYSLWGRMLYSPLSAPEGWRRFLQRDFGPAAAAMEQALSEASQILPLVTQAHLGGGGFQSYWPEIYTNMPMVSRSGAGSHNDTRSPQVFQAAEPGDVGLFYRMDEFAADVLAGARRGKVTPLTVADHLERLAQRALDSLSLASHLCIDVSTPAFRRAEADIATQAHLGRFFASKLRAGVAYALHEASGDLFALDDALARYRQALAAWDDVVAWTRDVYKADLAFGPAPVQRGHWAERRAGIVSDIQDMEERRRSLLVNGSRAGCRIAHIPAGTPFPTVTATVYGLPEGGQVRLCHRSAGMAPWQTVPMQKDADTGLLYRAELPPDASAKPARVWEYQIAAYDSQGVPLAISPVDGSVYRRFHDAPRPIPPLLHQPPAGFESGRPLVLELAPDMGLQQVPLAMLHYRHVNQAQDWRTADMDWEGARWRAAVPAEYTASPYPIMYYFEIRAPDFELQPDGSRQPVPPQACLHPGFDDRFLNRPYYVVQRGSEGNVHERRQSACPVGA